MTREEFVKKHADTFIAKLLRAFAMTPAEPMAARWLAQQIAEIDQWIGSLHDTLTEELKRGTSQKAPGADKGRVPQPGGAPATSAANRNAA